MCHFVTFLAVGVLCDLLHVKNTLAQKRLKNTAL